MKGFHYSVIGDTCCVEIKKNCENSFHFGDKGYVSNKKIAEAKKN